MANDAVRATTCRRNFKAAWLQTERTEIEGPSEKMSFNGEQFQTFKPKEKQKIQSSYGEQNQRTTRPWRQKLNMNHVGRKKLTEANLKKAFRIKLFEICKTRTKKSSHDLFNFMYSRLVRAWPMTMTGLPRAGASSKPHDYKQNVHGMKGLLKKWALTGNNLKFSNQKTKKIQSSYGEQNKSVTRPWRQKLNMNHVVRKK